MTTDCTDNNGQNSIHTYLEERFKKNLAAFHAYATNIAEMFKNYVPRKSINFFYTKDGIPNVVFNDSDKPLYKTENPIDYCKEQVEFTLKNTNLVLSSYAEETDPYGQIYYKYSNQAAKIANNCDKAPITLEDASIIPNAFIVGVGLGYVISEIFERVEIKSTVIIEPDLDQFYASLYTFDWENFLKYIKEQNDSVSFILGEKAENIPVILNSIYQETGKFLAQTFALFIHIINDEIKQTVRVLEHWYHNSYNCIGFLDDYLFGLSHAFCNIKNNNKFKLKNKSPTSLKEIPVFIVGSGPSIDNDIYFLRKYQDKAVIIACGTGLDTLYHAGVKPDFYAVTERVPEILQAINIIPDTDFFDDIILLTTEICHPSVTDFFTKNIIFFKANEPNYQLLCNHFNKIKEFKEINYINPLVGNMGVSAGLELGFEKIYLFGIDNGKRRNKKAHSQYTALYNQQKTNSFLWSYYNDPYCIYNKVYEAEANFDGVCETRDEYVLCAENISLITKLFKKDNPDIKVTNCSDGLKILDTESKHSSELVKEFEELKQISKSELITYIYTSNTGSIDIPSTALERILDKKIYNKICDEIISLLDQHIISREKYIDLMRIIPKQFNKSKDYIFYYNLIDSSIQTFFIIINYCLFLSKNESECVRKANEVKRLLIDFLQESKDLFNYLPNYVMGRHREYFSNGKVGKSTKNCVAPPLPPITNLIGNKSKVKQKIFVKRYE
jgi:hypothetical protein